MALAVPDFTMGLTYFTRFEEHKSHGQLVVAQLHCTLQEQSITKQLAMLRARGFMVWTVFKVLVSIVQVATIYVNQYQMWFSM